MPYAQINDLRLYYEEQGRGEPLVLLHGATGALDFPVAGWGGLVPQFAEHYRTVSPELRGHARTDNPAGTLSYAQLATDVAAFIEHLDAAPAHVAGVSLGGIVALGVAMTRPDLVRSLVCVGTPFRLDERARAGAQDFDPDAMERDGGEFAAWLAGIHDPHRHPGYWRELVCQIRAMIDAGPGYDEADLGRISVPTLLILGEIDRHVSLDQVLAIRRNIPDSEMLILNHAGMDDGANHLVQFTRADVVGPVVLDFLGRHPGPAAPGAGA